MTFFHDLSFWLDIHDYSYFSDILKIFVELKTEPLPLENIMVLIKQREQEKKFWIQFEEKMVKKVNEKS